MKNPWRQYSKINPQREDGNRQIANDVFCALMSTNFSGAELRIVMAIINKTWGFGKESDCISTAQFMEMTGLADRTVKKTIKTLKDKRIIYYEPSHIRVHHGSPLNEFIFNKHYDVWNEQGCINVHACIKMSSKGAQIGKLRVHDHSPTKETITKETITKDTTTKENLNPYSPEFLSFWIAYPKKSGSKKAAFDNWQKLKESMPPVGTVLEAIEKQIEWRKNAKDKFRPEWKDPERWIKTRMWEAELTEDKKSTW
jgi:phage replication O-like protein O